MSKFPNPVLPAAIIPVLWLLLPTSIVGRTWTNASGKTIEAEFVEVRGAKVQLLLPNGKTARVPINSLSVEDQIYIKNRKSGASTTGKPQPLILAIAEATRVSLMDPSGQCTGSIPADQAKIAGLKGRLYVATSGTVSVYDVQGAQLERIDLPKGLPSISSIAVTPDQELVWMSNSTDTATFLNARGELLRTVSFINAPPQRAQNCHGMVFRDKLLISENGNKEIIAISLQEDRSEVFRNCSEIPDAWIGALASNGDEVFVATGHIIYRIEGKKPEKLAEIPAGNITGFEIVGQEGFVVVNGMSSITVKTLEEKRQTKVGRLFKLNLKKGEVTPLLEGLNYPGGLALLTQD